MAGDVPDSRRGWRHERPSARGLNGRPRGVGTLHLRASAHANEGAGERCRSPCPLAAADVGPFPTASLILDVREWGASAERKAREPLFRKRVSTDLGELTFTSVTELDRENRQLLISERHALVHRGVERVSDYQFVMRCWDHRELSAALARHGFGNIAYFGAYDPHIEAGATDRLVAVAQVSGLVA